MIYLTLFLTFFEIGAFTFGGGYAMLPLIQAQVEAHGWLTNEELINFIAVSESTPGPFAVNVSTYVGMETGGVLGALCATGGVVLPSFLIILLVAKCFEKFQSNRYVKGAMSGLKPAVVGLIAAAVVSTGKTVFFASGFSPAAFSSAELYISVAIFLVMLFLSFKKAHPILVILLSGLCGIAAGYLPMSILH
jgi:chromate transporter